MIRIRLVGLALLNVHREFKISEENNVNRFANMKFRYLESGAVELKGKVFGLLFF